MAPVPTRAAYAVAMKLGSTSLEEALDVRAAVEVAVVGGP